MGLICAIAIAATSKELSNTNNHLDLINKTLIF